MPPFCGGDERVCAARKALRAEQTRQCYVGPQLHNPVHTKKAASLDDLFCVVGTVRLELMTSCMSSMRSNQLSYAPVQALL